jgi:hypothetical protein
MAGFNPAIQDFFLLYARLHQLVHLGRLKGGHGE